jgi:TPP-dependent pyruvate/acetoin dehydrogenase alpha subunit
MRGERELLARDVGPRLILRRFMARSNPYTGGRDNFNHFTDRDLGILGPVSPLGDQLCVLNGIALSFRKRDQDRVCMAFQGEGATRTGASHEGMNFAAALDLPMVVVLEHNRWSFSTRSDREAAVEEWTDVAAAYGLPVTRVDGNDLLEVLVAAEAAVTRARRGGGPSLLVAETYRMLGHAQHDAQPYVDPGELEEWRERDPIRRFEERLTTDHDFTESGLEEVRSEVDAEIDEAVDEALATPLPDPEDARRRVYADGMDPVPEAWTRVRPVGYPDLPETVEPARPGRDHD